ncbi:MAG: class I SAM-dependent methyltransferase [Methanoregula sp.]|nr:class I SAM-dependent methyltransferase [Methanoregula sp.]
MSHDPAQVYQPEADTYLLLDAAKKEVKPSDRVLEIGTGSGLISSELAKVSDVVATDINPHAALCASCSGVNVVQSDLFAGIRGTFSLILFNPPYLPTQPEERIDDWLEYALDGGDTGRVVIERFAAEVGRVLAPEGRILLLISSLTGLAEVSDLFSRQGFKSDVVLKQKIEDEYLYVMRIIRN